MASKHAWRTARRSENDMNCVELLDTLDEVRDSKNAAGPVLRGDLRALLRTIQTGRFHR